jgi:hypothetical protein
MELYFDYELWYECHAIVEYPDCVYIVGWYRGCGATTLLAPRP